MLSTAVLIPGLDPTTLIIEPSCEVPCSNCPVEPPWLSYIDLSSSFDDGDLTNAVAVAGSGIDLSSDDDDEPPPPPKMQKSMHDFFASERVGLF